MKNRIRIFCAAFLFSLHLALVSYLNALFLKSSFSVGVVDLLFIGGSVAACIFSFLAPRGISRLGIIKSTVLLLLTSSISLVIIGTTNQTLLIGVMFVFYFALNCTLLSLLDVALEHYSPKSMIGNIRGFYLMLTNSAWVFATASNTLLLTILPLRSIYLLAGGMLLLATLSLFRLEHVFHNPKHQAFTLRDIGIIWKIKPEIRKLYIAGFILQLFFAIMVIFSALYLRERFSLPTIAFIFSIMLLPFLLFQYPLGKVCDRYKITKQLIFWSFATMTVAVFLFTAFVPIASAVSIALILFLSRTGASVAEVAIESEFFTIVSDSDTAAIALYRVLNPFSYILAPLIGILAMHHFQTIFYILISILALTTLYIFPRKN